MITSELAEKNNIEAFISNMETLSHTEASDFGWWATYLAWSEVGSEEDMKSFYGRDDYV